MENIKIQQCRIRTQNRILISLNTNNNRKISNECYSIKIQLLSITFILKN